MKALLKLNYPHFKAELVAYKDEAQDTTLVSEGYKLLATYGYIGGVAFLNVYSKFKQTFVPHGVDGKLSVAPNYAVLVIEGHITQDGKPVTALDYLAPSKSGYVLEGNGVVYLIR